MTTTIDLPPIQKGDTIPYNITWTDNGTPIDMRGKTLVMMFKIAAEVPDEDASLTKVVVIAADDSNAQMGLTPFQLEPSESSLLLGGTDMHYALRLITPASPEPSKVTFMSGIVPVEAS